MVEQERGLGRLLYRAVSGDMEDSARDVERLLEHQPWARVVRRHEKEDAEALLVIESRDRRWLSRRSDRNRNETIEHRYTLRAVLEVAGRSQHLRQDQDFTERPYSYRNDDQHFREAAEKLVDQAGDVLLRSLDDLRPDRPTAGFVHQAKHTLLIKGDGLEVVSVEPGSPAERAGLQAKDRIRRIDGEKGTDEMDYRVLTWWLQPPGTRVALEVERNKQRQTLTLTLLPRSRWSAAPEPD